MNEIINPCEQCITKVMCKQKLTNNISDISPIGFQGYYSEFLRVDIVDVFTNQISKDCINVQRYIHQEVNKYSLFYNVDHVISNIIIEMLDIKDERFPIIELVEMKH